jgi:hypothetical protein
VRGEKRETRNEKRETRNEKREKRNEKREKRVGKQSRKTETEQREIQLSFLTAAFPSLTYWPERKEKPESQEGGRVECNLLTLFSHFSFLFSKSGVKRWTKKARLQSLLAPAAGWASRWRCGWPGGA